MNKIYILTITFFITLLTSAQVYYGTNIMSDNGSGILLSYNSAKDSQGNLYTVGLFQTSITVGTTTVTSNGGSADGFISKHNLNGDPIWVKSIGGNADDVIANIAIDSNDNIYLTGYFQGAGPNACDVDPGPDVYPLSQLSTILSRDCFIIKLDENADFVWAKQVSNTSAGAANEDSSSIEVDSMGNVYVGGAFHSADFNPSPTETFLLNSADGGYTQDGFILKLDSNGNFVWVKTLSDNGGHCKVNDLKIDSDGAILAGGIFQNTVDLNPSTVDTANFTSNGSWDSFILKTDQNGNYLWGNSFGGTGLESVKKLSIIDTNVYINGGFSGNVDFNPTTSQNNFTSLGTYDGYLTKFDNNGNYVSTITIGGNGTEIEEIFQIIKIPNNNYLISGNFEGQADFDFSGNTVSSSSNGNTDNYIVELDINNNYITHYTIGGNMKESYPLAHLINDKLFIIGGFRSANMDTNPFEGTDTYSSLNSTFYNMYMSIVSWPTLDTPAYATSELIVYPNPTSDYLDISFGNPLTEFQIFNIYGKLILNGTIENNQINVSNISNGLYVLLLKNNDSNQFFKFEKIN